MFEEGADPRPQYKEVAPGQCPKPGHFPSRIKDFNFTRLNGTWIRVIDEKEWIGNYTCTGSVLRPYQGIDEWGYYTYNIQWMNSNMYTEQHKEYQLSVNKDFDDTLDYLVD
jgi:hypothetical protein